MWCLTHAVTWRLSGRPGLISDNSNSNFQVLIIYWETGSVQMVSHLISLAPLWGSIPHCACWADAEPDVLRRYTVTQLAEVELGLQYNFDWLWASVYFLRLEFRNVTPRQVLGIF